MPDKPTKRAFYALALLAGLAVASLTASGDGAPADSPLQPYSAQYVLKKKGMNVAEATFNLTRDGDHWRFESHAKPVGIAALFVRQTVSERSLFRLEDGLVVPLEYHLTHDGGEKADDDVHVVYDRPADEARVRHGRKETTLSLEEPLYDTLSEQAALMLAIRRPEPQTDFRVVDEGRAERHRFALEGPETVETPRGRLEAVKAVRNHGSRRTVIWFAPELNHVPIKMQRYKNGGLKSELALQSVDFTPPAPETPRER